MIQRILIVEDEPQIADILADYMSDAGFHTTIVSNGNDVVPLVKKQAVDLILLDIMLPGMDGMEVCRQLRQFTDVPIIMVTARIEEIDRLLGFGFGADDYICKPFSPKEVVARVQAVLRRFENKPVGETFHRGPLLIDKQERRASYDRNTLSLTRVEFELLVVFATRPGRVYSRSELITMAQGYDAEGYERTVDSHIKNLRKKLSAAGAQKDLLETVYGVGYRFEI